MVSRGIIVALLVVLAGCAGGLPAWSEDATDRPAADGTDRPTATTERDRASPTERTDAGPSREYLAPGLTADGVGNVSMLLDHHFASLEAESGDGTYEALTRTSTTTNGTLASAVMRRQVVQHPDHWYESVTRTSYEANATEVTAHEGWAEESVFLSRSRSTDGPAEYDGYEWRGLRDPQFFEYGLATWVELGHVWNPNVTVEERTRNGTTWYVVAGTHEGDAGVVEFTYNVREDGRIDRLTLEGVEDTSGPGTVTRTTTVEFGVDSNGTLERPDWYEEAREATSTETE